VNVYDPVIGALAGTFLSRSAGWALAAVTVAGVVLAQVAVARRRARAGLELEARRLAIARSAGVAAIVFAAVAVLNADRGVPLALLLLLGFIVGFDFVLRRTRFGRHVLAVGGNAEAARRAGIRVDGIRLAVFSLSGALAACSGVLAASRLLAVNQSSAAAMSLELNRRAVIGGTSLFGGRGSVWSALTGALIIGSISNGMDLLALPSSAKFMVTGAALLVAVTLDAIARAPSGRSSVGRVADLGGLLVDGHASTHA